MRFALRGRSPVDGVVTRALAFPSTDYRRWQIIGELATADFKSAFDRAAAMIRSADPAAMVLGAEILDQLFIGLREGHRFARQAAELLAPLCRPAQDPEVLSAALPPFVQVRPDAQSLLYELLDHSDGHVRCTVAQLIPAVATEFAEDRQVDSLIALLDHDADQGVREQAAESLELILTCCPYVSQSPRIVDALTERLDDRAARIRAAALAALSAISAADVDTTLKRLVAELAAARPAWQFVDCFDRLPPLDDAATAELRAQAHRALLRLRDEGWPQQADPARFPVVAERDGMLAKAIAVTAPERDAVPTERRRATRPRLGGRSR